MGGEDVIQEREFTRGLTTREAEKRIQTYGYNELKHKKNKSAILIFLSQFNDFIVWVLIVATVISGIMGDKADAVTILIIVFVNAILGFVQEFKTEKSLEALQELAAPTCKVIRDGSLKVITSRELTLGDVVVVEAGDRIPADGKFIDASNMVVDESLLTGESVGVSKDTTKDKNHGYMGTIILKGRGMILIDAIGMNTEMGKIANLLDNIEEERSPLKERLNSLGKILVIACLVICAVVTILGIIRGNDITEMFLLGVSLAVAAIPEGLAAIVTVALALGVNRMLKRNALVRRLPAVETLGCTSVICSDKTGTLTQNKMTVQKIYINGESIFEEELDLNNQSHRYLLYDMVLNNDSSIVDGKGIGDPTEYALLETLRKLGYNEDDLRSGLKRLEEVPFDSDRKMMSTKYKLHGVNHILTKGAIDAILDRCDSIATKDGVRPITQADKADILKQNTEYSENGLRVLTFAYKESDEELNVNTEYGYTFLGLVSMIDPPREESKAAVADAVRAGIKPVMITGDHKITATAIARQIGIFREGDIAVTGMELDAMSDSELDQKIEKISVYARVSPENKIRIVEAWQRKGNIVSMTGDGVNDAPALKKADIGVAMGITGTEVSKDAASMVLQDDNFATIIKAVANGRNVYRNIKNAILFLLSGNMAAIFAVVYASLLALPVPFEAVHLLFINLLTDSLPAIAIGMEKPEKDLLSQKPRDPKQGILTKEFSALMLLQGALIAVVVMTAFYIGLQVNAATASTMAFATLTLARLFHGFNCRSKHSIFKIGLASNVYSLLAFAAGVGLLAFVIFVPFMHPLFKIAELTGAQIGFIALLAFIPTVIIQIAKVIAENIKKSK